MSPRYIYISAKRARHLQGSPLFDHVMLILLFPTKPLTSWNVEELKDYLGANHLPLTGVKSDLVQRVKECFYTMFVLKAKSFQYFKVTSN